MSDAVQVAIIAALPGILGVLISLRSNHNAKFARRNAASANRQVTNNHDTNLREEQDERHSHIMQWLRRLDKSIGGVHEDVRLVSKRVSVLEEIEMTQPKDQFMKTKQQLRKRFIENGRPR